VGAGGGFQGGVVFAASFILMFIAFGLPGVEKRLGKKWLMIYSVIGIAIYAGIGFLCLAAGGNYLEYGAIESAVGVAHLHGYLIDAVEMGIGITVMAVMVSIISDVMDRERESP